MELIIICLRNFQTSKIYHLSVWRRNETSCSLTWTLLKVLNISENSLCLTPNQEYKTSRILSLLPLLPSCDIKTNELFTGFGFSERCQKLQLLNFKKTRSEQKCDRIRKHHVHIGYYIENGLTTNNTRILLVAEISGRWYYHKKIDYIYHHLF